MRLALMLSLTAAPALAQPDPIEEGRALAEAWCVECHVVAPEQGTAADAGPAFATIAGDPLRTDAGLAAWLADPHPIMPNLKLSRSEIEALIAYIRSLGD